MTLSDLADPEIVHATLSRMAKSRAQEEYVLGVWLLAAERLRIHELLGYASFGEYVERLFGFKRREVRERVRVAIALESLTELAASLRDGRLCWSVVRELTRVANEETEGEWKAAATGQTAREVESMVSQHQPGARPTDKPSAEPARAMTFDAVSAPTRAILAEVRKAMTAELGGAVDDDALLATLARTFLAGAKGRDEGRASYSIALTICERCKTATQAAGAGEVVVDEATVERAHCDAQHLGRVDVANPPRATQAVPPKVRRAVMRRHGGRCAVPGCRHAAFVDLHHTDRRADGGSHDPDRLLPLCGMHHAAAHRGTLVVRGTYSTGFVFEHADGTAFGEASASPTKALAFAQVLEALVTMGFKQREAQGMLDRAMTHVGRLPSAEEVLRAALREAPLPRGAGLAREQPAAYARLAA